MDQLNGDAPSDAAAAALPILPAQQPMVAGLLSGRAASAWSVTQVTRLDGVVDVEAFASAIRSTAIEMDAMRVRLRVDGARASQWVANEVGEIVNIMTLPAGGDADSVVRAAALELSERPWDLTADKPLFRFELLSAGGSVYWVQHASHAVTDGFGAWLIRERIAERYNHIVSGGALRAGPFPSLADVAEIPVRDEASAGNWRDYLSGAPQRLSPANVHRPVADRPHRHDIQVSAQIRDDLGQTLGNRVWTYPLIAAMGAFVAHISEEPEAVIGTPVLGRYTPAEKLVPTNMMSVTPLRVSVPPGDNLKAITERVVADARANRAYARIPQEQYFEALPVSWRSGRYHGPIVNVMPFNGEPEIPGVVLTSEAIQRGPVADMTYTIHPLANGTLLVECQAHRELYSAHETREWAERLAVYLQRVSRPGVVVADVDARLPSEITAADELAREIVPQASEPFPSWGDPVDVDRLDVPTLGEVPRGWEVVDRLRRRVGCHQVGELVAMAGERRVSTGLLVHQEPDGRLIAHGTVDERRLVYGRYVEAAGVARALRGLPGVTSAAVRWEGSTLFAQVGLAEGSDEATVRSLARETVPSGCRLRVSLAD